MSRHDSAAWAIRASSASGIQLYRHDGGMSAMTAWHACTAPRQVIYDMHNQYCNGLASSDCSSHTMPLESLCLPSGGGFSPFITPASTPRGNSISRNGSVTSSNAGSTPRWSSSSYGPVAFGSPVKTDGMSTPRAAAVSLLASSPRIPAAIAGMPMVPALSPSVSGQGSSPAGVPPKAPPRRTTSGSESEHIAQAFSAGQRSGVQTPSSGPRRSRSTLSEATHQASQQTLLASPLERSLRGVSRP